jgi:hypothetical protein
MCVYQWFVFSHLVGLVLFVFAHGASAFVSWQIRPMRDPDVVAGYLLMSAQATRAAYVGLLLLLIGGAGAATEAGLWSKPWVWGSVIVLIAVVVGMYAVGASYYYRLRDLLAGKDGQPPIGPEALAAYLDSRRPDIIGGIGALGLLTLVWLMVMKPV